MGLANSLPVFLDNNAGFNKNQVEQINTVVRTARRFFENKATQKQLPEPDVEKLISSKYGRVLDPKDYLYNKTFSLSFILNPFGFELGGEYPLFETDKTIRAISFEGSNSYTRPANYLSNLGHIYVSNNFSKPTVMFVCDTNNWPVDGQGNKVQYSVFIYGNIV